jgi:response regulator of citrate/malate metabolism
MHISQTLLTSVNFDLFILDFYFPFLVGLHVVDGIPKEKERAIGNIVSVKSACAM